MRISAGAVNIGRRIFMAPLKLPLGAPYIRILLWINVNGPSVGMI